MSTTIDFTKITLSKSAKEFIQKRMGLHKKAQKTLMLKVRDRGIAHSDTTGQLFKWITSRLLNFSPTRSQGYIYNNGLYIIRPYSDGTSKIITVITVPASLQREVANATRKKYSSQK